METSEAALVERLDKIRPVKIYSIWTSATPYVELCRNNPPDWLYTSCQPARYNPKGIPCVYFADGGRTARAEHACNGESELQPIVFFSAKVSLRHVLDITNTKTLKALGLTQSQLFE